MQKKGSIGVGMLVSCDGRPHMEGEAWGSPFCPFSFVKPRVQGFAKANQLQGFVSVVGRCCGANGSMLRFSHSLSM
jgi:hypothetical protein